MNRRFRFASTHRLCAPRDAVFDILADAERWPQWWPQIRSITRYDDAHGAAQIRSVLPLTLHVELTSELADRESGVLRAELAGDLVGWSQFELRAAGAATTILKYTQEVDFAPSGVAARLGALPLSRPVLLANHWFMMRSGMRRLADAAEGRAPRHS
ncbi:SRPBCC family protein [Flexivirga caeni]|uniref:Polyketide cyclase n=1 Tax=Flexivirga caeni TaxID=2294115 RepID=A0A3M9MIX1_9MICO|nr:SRPBCC family protein [Flexivirga caeni]RNI25454.1 polyketide cyclase [Flexivirga caeni]